MKRLILIGLLIFVGLSAAMGQSAQRKALIHKDAQKLLAAIQNLQTVSVDPRYSSVPLKVVQARYNRLKKDTPLVNNLGDAVNNVNVNVQRFIEFRQYYTPYQARDVQSVTDKAVAAVQALIKATSP